MARPKPRLAQDRSAAQGVHPRHGRACPRPKGAPSLDRRRRHPRQHRRRVTPLILPLVVSGQAPAGQQPFEPSHQRQREEHAIHLLVRRCRQRLKAQPTAPLLDIHSVEDQRMHVDVQIQRGPEALQDGHRASTPLWGAGTPGAPPERPEHDADEYAAHRPAEIVVPRQQVAETVRQTQLPLSDGHGRKHVVDQVRGALGHAPAATTGAHRAAFARKRNQAFSHRSPP
jgi:hypothetical protein